jgi:hypothetical protein
MRRFACAWVDACLPVERHRLSLALTRALASPACTNQHQSYRHGFALVLPRFATGDPVSPSPYVGRFSLRYWSAFGVCKVGSDGCLLVWFWLPLGCCLVSVWFPFGFRLILVWFGFGLARVCVFVSGWFLVVRSPGPVLDGVDDVVAVICLVCLVYLDSLVSWFCLGRVCGETCLFIWGTYAVHMLRTRPRSWT